MNLEFPRFVYTSPGPTTCNGGTYGERLVQDQDEYDAAIAVDFCPSIPEALAAAAAGKVAPKVAPPKPATDEDIMAALVAKAKDLGVKVDPKWSEKRLATEIAKAEAEA